MDERIQAKWSKQVKQIQKTKQPLVPTVNGKRAAVVQDAVPISKWSMKTTEPKRFENLKKPMGNVRNGDRLVSAEEVFAKLSENLGISLE